MMNPETFFSNKQGQKGPVGHLMLTSGFWKRHSRVFVVMELGKNFNQLT